MHVPAGAPASLKEASALSQDFGLRVKLLSLLRGLQLSSACRNHLFLSGFYDSGPP